MNERGFETNFIFCGISGSENIRSEYMRPYQVAIVAAKREFGIGNEADECRGANE